MCHGHLQHQCMTVIILLKLNHQSDYDMTEVEIVFSKTNAHDNKNLSDKTCHFSPDRLSPDNYNHFRH